MGLFSRKEKIEEVIEEPTDKTIEQQVIDVLRQCMIQKYQSIFILLG